MKFKNFSLVKTTLGTYFAFYYSSGKRVPFWKKASKSISDFKWFQSASWGVTNWLNKCVFSVTSWGKRDDGRKERDLCKYVLLKYINCKGYILYHNSLDRESLFAIIWLKTYLLPSISSQLEIVDIKRY